MHFSGEDNEGLTGCLAENPIEGHDAGQAHTATYDDGLTKAESWRVKISAECFESGASLAPAVADCIDQAASGITMIPSLLRHHALVYRPRSFNDRRSSGYDGLQRN